jgi:hypothetical protein
MVMALLTRELIMTVGGLSSDSFYQQLLEQTGVS